MNTSFLVLCSFCSHCGEKFFFQVNRDRLFMAGFVLAVQVKFRLMKVLCLMVNSTPFVMSLLSTVSSSNCVVS